MTQTADTVACDHPIDGIHWNEWNKVTQCHRCGHVMDRTPMPSGDAMHYEPPPNDRYGAPS